MAFAGAPVPPTRQTHVNAPTDLELVDRSALGDREAFGQVVERYQTLVCSVAYSLLGDFTWSEDIGQDAFVAAWKQLPTLRDRSRFKPWLCAITRNLAMAALRAKRRTVGLNDVNPLIAGGPSPVSAAERREEEELVWKALAGLPESYREPLVLFYRQDCSVALVAEALDLSPSAIKQRLSRGRELLREEVTAMLQRSLKRRVPTAVFTAAVLGALPGVGVASASAAALGTAGKSTPLAASALKAGTIGALAGSLIGLAGGAFGAWVSWQSARYQRERDLIKRQTSVFAIVMAIFLAPFAAMGLGWAPWRYGTGIYLTAYLIWMGVFFSWLPFWIWRCQRQWRHTISDAQLASDAPLHPTRVSRWTSGWQGRQWTSRWHLFGLPLVEIAASGPRAGYDEVDRTPRIARAWIAIGDRAYGVLFAYGTIAVGGIACGAVSVGLLAVGAVPVGIIGIGGCALAVFSYAGLAIGAVACGGIALGWLAFGGVAIAWRAAKGGVAVAHEYGVGGVAVATHANDARAEKFIASSPFFQFIDNVTQPTWQSGVWFQGILLCGIIGLIALSWLVMYERSHKTTDLS